MWKQLYVSLTGPTGIGDDYRMRAVAYIDPECKNRAEELAWDYRPHCGGMGCRNDYHYSFIEAASAYFATRAEKVELLEPPLNLPTEMAVRRRWFAEEDETKNDAAHRLIASCRKEPSNATTSPSGFGASSEDAGPRSDPA
jgi:hypothetical protein